MLRESSLNAATLLAADKGPVRTYFWLGIWNSQIDVVSDLRFAARLTAAIQQMPGLRSVGSWQLISSAVACIVL